MLKHEDWPGLRRSRRCAASQHDGSHAAALDPCGNGGLFLDFEMERGADGA